MALQEVGGLIGLSFLGGLWAVAWGTRRAQRPQRTAMLDARTQVQVRLDAVRARTAEINRHTLPPDARRLVDHAIEDQVLVDAVLSRAASVEDVIELAPQIDDALIAIDQAARIVGLEMPADDPYAGLCPTDPAHGPITSDADERGGWCDSCADAVQAGTPPAPRQVTRGGRPTAFDQLQDRV